MRILAYLREVLNIVAGLDNSDADQRQTLYQWSANQLGHAALALIVALAASEVGASPFWASLAAFLAWLLKEVLLDLGKRLTPLTLADSATDVVFYAVGAGTAFGFLSGSYSVMWGAGGYVLAAFVLGYFWIGRRS